MKRQQMRYPNGDMNKTIRRRRYLVTYYRWHPETETHEILEDSHLCISISGAEAAIEELTPAEATHFKIAQSVNVWVSPECAGARGFWQHGWEVIKEGPLS